MFTKATSVTAPVSFQRLSKYHFNPPEFHMSPPESIGLICLNLSYGSACIFLCFSTGHERSGLFCATYSALDKNKVDQEVDVFQIVRQVRANRPQLVGSYVSIIHSTYSSICMVDWSRLVYAEGAPTRFMVASGGVLSEECGHGGAGVCLGDGQTEAYLKNAGMAGLASAWAMARRRPREYRRKVDAATRCSGVCPHT